MARFFSSLQLKFAATYIVVIAAILVVLNTYPLMVSQDLIFRTKQTSLQSQAAVMGSSLGLLGTLSVESVEKTMELLNDGSLRRVLVTDESGLVLYDTDGSLNAYALYYEIVRALTGRDVFYASFEDGVFHSRTAAPIYYRNQMTGVLYLYEYDSVQGTLLRSVQSNLLTISFIVCALVTVLSLVFSKALTVRISELLRAMRIVREGEYDHRIDIRGKDELAQLGIEFNRLTGRIETTEELRRRFVADASHELKTPLASIRLLTDSILQSSDMNEETRREFVADIGREAERLSHITVKLLALTKLDNAIDADSARPLRVKHVVDAVLRMLSPLASAQNVSLLAPSLSPDCFVLMTEDALHQIIFNLVENAIKYNRPGGTVELTLTRGGGWAVLQVADTGVGIPEEDLSRIFERFYRVDKARARAAGGTGLGLSIAQEAARQFGGRITAAARADGGACFTVELPLTAQEVPHEA